MKRKSRRFIKPIFNSSDFAEKAKTSLGSIDFGQDLDIVEYKKKSHNLFLNRFSEDDITKFMVKAGLVDYLSDLGFKKLKFKIYSDESLVHYLEIYNKKINPENLLIDLRVSENRFVLKKEIINSKRSLSFDMVVIEWLYTQNPKNKEFAKEKPQLPGQLRPGLGCLRKLMLMNYYVTRQFTKDGFLDVPDHFYLSLMYAKKYLFFDPKQQALMQAIIRDLKKYSLLDISWGVITKTIKFISDGKPFIYKPSEQIYPVSRRLKKYFKSRYYKNIYKRKLKEYEFYFDYEEMLKQKKKILKTKDISEL